VYHDDTTTRPVLLTAAAIALLAGCSVEPRSPTAARQASVAQAAQAPHASHGDAGVGKLTAEVNRGVADVRRATARFHELADAQASGYTEQWPPGCATAPEGGQAFHYIDPALRDDGVIDLLRPELLMYEPGPNGTLHLIGVDYFMPYADWKGTEPPTLLGQSFSRVDALNAYTLHIWAWRPNPSGMFAAWNPKVSCAYAP
jgi:hypothetical protein